MNPETAGRFAGRAGREGEGAGADSAGVDRRGFLVAAVGGAAGLLGGVRALPAASFRPFAVGNIADYPRDGISERFIQHDVFVVRRAGRIFACTAICPHKANALLRDPQDAARIVCSGHDSVFDSSGRPMRGPARRPLARHAITADAAGNLTVDTSRSFGPGQWEEPASWVGVPERT